MKDATSSTALTEADLVASVKERLYPLTPLTSFLEWLIERLPRRRVAVRLTPQNSVAEIDREAGEYKALSEGPSFLVEMAPEFVKGGWFYLEAALVRHTGDREARFFGKSGNIDFEIPIPSNLRGTVREVFYLPARVTSLFWAPMRAPGYFSQSRLLIHHISPLESFFRRAHRVVLTLVSMRGSSARTHHGLTWGNSAINLQEAYIKTARMQIQRYRGHDYTEFISRHDVIKPAEMNAIQNSLQAASVQPRISLIVLVGNAQPSLLSELLSSICEQAYPHWELMITFDSSASTVCRRLVEDAQRQEQRIVTVSTEHHTDTSSRLNAMVQRLTGEFFAVVEQHDMLPTHALLMIAAAIQSHPDLAIVYADHDHLDTEKRRYAPHFKPDWNPDFFTAHDYMDIPRLWKTELVRSLGGFRQGFDNAECYDLTLRCVAESQNEQILHIPRVLYHRRKCTETTEAAPPPAGAKSSEDAGLLAVADHVKKFGATVTQGAIDGIYRICHSIPSPPPLVSIIIPTRDKIEILKACIESIQHKTDYSSWEVLIVDNGSEDPLTLAWLKLAQQDPRIRVIAYPKAFNYSAINNYAVQHALGEIVVLMNNDIEVISGDWLTEMVGHALRPEIGAVGAKLLYPNGMVQHAGVVLGIGGVAGHVHRYLGGTEPGYCFRAVATQNYSVVTAACLAVRKTVYEEVGGLDEINLKVAFNDVDFCLKVLNAGYRNVFTPHALLYHHESLSRGHDDTPEKKAIFEQEFGYMKAFWGKIVDHAYNPNLSLEFEDFSLKRF